MCVPSGQHHSTQAMQVGVLLDCLQEASRQPEASVLRQDVDVRQVCEGGPIRDEAGEANLLTMLEHRKAQ